MEGAAVLGQTRESLSLMGVFETAAQPEEIAKTHHQAGQGGDGNRQADDSHIGIRQAAEEYGEGNAYQKSGQQPLEHDKGGSAQAVEVSQKTTTEGDHQVSKGAAPEVLGGSRDDSGI